MGSKQRSPNYPAMGLSDAVAAVKLIHDQEKRTAVPTEVIAKDLGYKGLSGPVRTKVAALKKYGLLDGDERKGLRVSDLAIRILFPSDDAQATEAKRNAALTPELFKTIYEEMREGSDSAVTSYLIQKREFAPVGAKQAIAAYRDSITFADLSGGGYNYSDKSDESEAEKVNPPNIFEPPVRGTVNPPPKGNEAVNRWDWTLSFPRSVRAVLQIAGPVTKADFARLKAHLELLEGSFDEETIN